jgi:hypothetical protein
MDTRNVPPTRTGLPQKPTDVESDVEHPRGQPGHIRLQRECCNPGEDSHEGMLVSPSQVLLLVLDDPVETLLNSLSVLEQWLEKNDGQLRDEVRVQRIKHWKREVLEQLDMPRI